MDKDVSIVPHAEVEVVEGEASEYKEVPTHHFVNIPEVAKPLLREAEIFFSKIERTLYAAPAFINAVKAAVPDVTLQAVLTDEQKQQLARGALKLMGRKDGSLLANIINPETKRIITNIPLESVKMAPEMTQALTYFSAQMQMAQIAEQIQTVQIAVEEIRMGQEYDRLATAYSCQQKLLQAMDIKSRKLRTMALIQLVQSAEDSRNLLMLSQKRNVEFIMSQPEGIIQKILSGAKPEK